MPTDLSTNYFIGAVAISVLGVAVNQANITHRVFVAILFVLGVALGIMAIFWSDIAPHIPAVAASITEIANNLVSWLSLLIAVLLIVFFLNFAERIGLFRKRWVNTYVRFVRSTATPNYYESERMANIYRWRQIYMTSINRDQQTGKEIILFDADVFVFVFEKATPYGRPRIETFGHEFPKYNWIDQTKRVAILLVEGNIDMPFFEVYFSKP